MDLKAQENIFPLEILFNFTLIYLFPNSYMSSIACTFQICAALLWSLIINLKDQKGSAAGCSLTQKCFIRVFM